MFNGSKVAPVSAPASTCGLRTLGLVEPDLDWQSEQTCLAQDMVTVA